MGLHLMYKRREGEREVVYYADITNCIEGHRRFLNFIYLMDIESGGIVYRIREGIGSFILPYEEVEFLIKDEKNIVYVSDNDNIRSVIISAYIKVFG